MLDSPSPEQLAALLLRLGGREARLLEHRLVDDLAPEVVASHLGIPVSALARALWRAARAFEELAGTRRAVELTPSEETSAVEAFHQWLANPVGPVPSLTLLGNAVRALATTPKDVGHALTTLRRESEEGPRARRNELVRRGVIALLVLGTAWFFWRTGGIG